MSDKSAIEWTDATWNPTTGCTKVSPGCAHCYIERTPAFRIHGRKFVRGATDLRLHADRLEQPLHWRKPRRVFVNSQSDLFHDHVPDTFIDQVFAVMALTPQHTYQVLTKRPERMHDYIDDLVVGQCASCSDYRTSCKVAGHPSPAQERVWRHIAEMNADRTARPFARGIVQVDAPPRVVYPLPNVWLGVSVENQHFADERIPLLLQTPAAVRFISAEPLLEAVKLHESMFRCCRSEKCDESVFGLDWVIVGVEKVAGRKVGRNATDYEAHARAVLRQCAAAGVAAFHKQMPVRGRVSADPTEWSVDLRVREFPVGAAERPLVSQ